MNKKLRNLTFLLLISLIPLLTACSIQIPTSMDDVKDLFSGEKQEAAKDTQAPEQQPSPFKGERKTSPLGKLEEILGRNTSMECTFAYENYSGTIYTDGNAVRTIARMQLDNETMEVESLYKEDTVYSWNKSQDYGVRFEMDQMEEYQEDSEIPQVGSQNFLNEMEYSCEEKAIDPTLLEVPADINFQNFEVPDLGDMREAPSQEDLCKMCDMIPNAAEKASCQAELGC